MIRGEVINTIPFSGDVIVAEGDFMHMLEKMENFMGNDCKNMNVTICYREYNIN